MRLQEEEEEEEDLGAIITVFLWWCEKPTTGKWCRVNNVDPDHFTYVGCQRQILWLVVIGNANYHGTQVVLEMRPNSR